MKKLLIMFVCVSLCVSSVNASLNSNQIAALRGGLKSQITVGGVTYVWNSETGQAVVKGSAGAGSAGNAGNAGNAGGTQLTRAQMETAVALKPADALAAVQKAIANINLDPSQNPDATVYNYIMG